MHSQAVITDKALESVWTQFSDRLHSFIRSRVPDEATAEDIHQEVFLRIHTKMGTLTDMGKLESWIYQVTRNAIIDYYRTQRPTDELPETLVSCEDAHEDDLVTRLAADVREMAEACQSSSERLSCSLRTRASARRSWQSGSESHIRAPNRGCRERAFKSGIC